MRNELAYDHIFFSSLIPPRGSLHERLAELAAVRVLSPGFNGLGAEFGAPSYLFMSDSISVLSRYSLVAVAGSLFSLFAISERKPFEIF